MSTGENYTINKLHNDAERYTWAAYIIFVIVSSIIGDILILYASYKKDAFRLNKLIVIAIRYIAVFDLTSVITKALPRAVSLVADAWILENVICYAMVYFSYFSYNVGNYLIAILTSSKVLILKFPLRSATWSRKMAHLACSLALLPPLILISCMLVIDKDDVGFGYKHYACFYGFKAYAWKNLVPLLSFLLLFLPNVCIVASTILILRYACKSAKRHVNTRVRWQGTLAVALTAVVYCISSLPLFIFDIGKNFVKEHPNGPFFLHFHRVANTMLLINTMSNFYIYILTIRSFQTFILSKILFIFSNLQVMAQNIRNNISTGE
jgi:hypothetical protein